jgi:hypothetical protein
MMTPPDTKPCRHCRQPIHPEARVCQHCRNGQSLWGNNRDPRFVIGVMCLALGLSAAFVPLVLFSVSRFTAAEQVVEPPTVVVGDVSTRVVTTPEGMRLFVMGVARNTSSRDASRIWFRVTIRDAGEKLVDTLLLEDRGLLVPSGKSLPFRISGLLSIGSLDGARTEVVAERATAPSKWD